MSDLETCFQCHGLGGWHDCGEDTCCCIDPEEITLFCDECNGEGVLICRDDETDDGDQV